MSYTSNRSSALRSRRGRSRIPLGDEPTVYSRRAHVTDDEPRIDGLTRGQMCHKFRQRILLLARRLSERLPPDCELSIEDLVSFGAIGLLEAFDRFDPTRQIQFSTFAEYRIRGAMMDALRQSDSFTRYRRQLARRIRDATETLTAVLGHPPEPQQIADHLGMDLEDYWQAVNRVMPVTHVSIWENDDPESEAGGRSFAEAIIGTDGQDAYRAILATEARAHLKSAIVALPERKRQCILLYYGRGLNLAEIAQVFNVTPSRISQILSAARRDLRKTLSGHLNLGDFTAKDLPSQAGAL